MSLEMDNERKFAEEFLANISKSKEVSSLESVELINSDEKLNQKENTR